MAELGSMSGRRGEAGGHGNGERWRRLRSGALGEERTREEGEREGVRAVRGSAWRRSRHPDEEGRGRQAGREVAWPSVWPRPAVARARTCLGEGEKTTEELAGWAASWLGRPAAAGLRRGGEAQVSPSFFYFCFLIFLTLF